jgi:hypothetical protein
MVKVICSCPDCLDSVKHLEAINAFCENKDGNRPKHAPCAKPDDVAVADCPDTLCATYQYRMGIDPSPPQCYAEEGDS